MEKEPLELQKFKLQCTYCIEQLVMIPRQRNLETNLAAHCASLSHINCVTKSKLPASGEPILSGRPGRPRQADKRDVRQRTIGVFFTPRPSETGSSGQSSATSAGNPKGILDNLSLLCWGLWRDVVQYGGQSRPVKEILQDQVRVDGSWYPEPLSQAEVMCESTGQLCRVDGIF